ncbi:GTP-binding protein ypt4 [Zalerion maritima]|uniref:GTP-binding protein ypt4 n=1 Tax=Zalerion maritima TaxID=339359 RepID=A0AAD5WP66_9PEZI|nr:GTP-binding protein ypt4 [Zalerion maritima]
MTRPRRGSGASEDTVDAEQELGSMYDYLAKIILLGPSGTGKSCMLHRFVKNEWRVLSSQTIGVEFASKIIKVGTGPRRKRIKLQVCRYICLDHGAHDNTALLLSSNSCWTCADEILVARSYGIPRVQNAFAPSFKSIQPFLNDARALASPNLSVILAGNKLDLANDNLVDTTMPPPTPSSVGSSSIPYSTASGNGSVSGIGGQMRATIAPEGRQVWANETSRWASSVGIPVVTEVSAFNGDGVDEVFQRLARMILTKIELGEVNPDDPSSGIQYGDSGVWMSGGASEVGSIKSSINGTIDEGPRRRRGKGRQRGGTWTGLREWEDVFTLSNRRRNNNCC